MTCQRATQSVPQLFFQFVQYLVLYTAESMVYASCLVKYAEKRAKEAGGANNGQLMLPPDMEKNIANGQVFVGETGWYFCC